MKRARSDRSDETPGPKRRVPVRVGVTVRGAYIDTHFGPSVSVIGNRLQQAGHTEVYDIDAVECDQCMAVVHVDTDRASSGYGLSPVRHAVNFLSPVDEPVPEVTGPKPRDIYHHITVAKNNLADPYRSAYEKLHHMLRLSEIIYDSTHTTRLYFLDGYYALLWRDYCWYDYRAIENATRRRMLEERTGEAMLVRAGLVSADVYHQLIAPYLGETVLLEGVTKSRCNYPYAWETPEAKRWRKQLDHRVQALEALLDE